MKRLYIQGDGSAVLLDNPDPEIEKEGIVVEVQYALISAGTELSTIASSKSLLKRFFKEKRIRDMALRVIKGRNLKEILYYFKRFILKSKGKRRFTSPAPSLKSVGYSCSGTVTKSNVPGTNPGDRVSCAGSNHAELIYSAKNMFVTIPANVTLKQAAFGTVGAIALQSIHQAQIKPGDVVGVIGTGLIGQIVVQLVKISGARVVAFDIIPERLQLAKKLGADLVINPAAGVAKIKVNKFTDGLGLDSVIVAASSNSPSPLVSAFELVRNKGKVVLLGAVPINIPRDNFYAKEVDFLISRSYGAGRYDSYYEEEGHDYPIEHVRWTENRNIELIIDLIAKGKLNVDSLITDVLPGDKATLGYERLKLQPNTSLAILLDFSCQPEKAREKLPAVADAAEKKLRIGLIGCGAFAQANHIPFLRDDPRCKIKAICTKSKSSADNCMHNYHPDYVTTDYKKVLQDPEIDTIFIYTRHGEHAKFSIEALKAGKNVYVEKPMGITLQECLDVAATVKATGKLYQIGFNRRMSPFVIQAKELLKERKSPILLNYRVAAPYIPADNWVYDPKDGGGRVIGEACHFLDLILYLNNSHPVELIARGGALSNKGVGFIDNFSCIIKFADDSIATLEYSDLNAEKMPKERIEIFSGLSAIIIDDFQEMKVGGFLVGNQILPSQDKGHGNEMSNVIAANLGKARPFVNEKQALNAMKICFYIEESVRNNSMIKIEGILKDE